MLKTILKNSIYFLVFLLTSCSLAPKYQRPKMNVPFIYKEIGHWKQIDQNQVKMYSGRWWDIFNDTILNELENRISCTNENLKAAFARLELARAVLQVTRSNLFPMINGDANVTRVKTSKNIANKSAIPLYSDMLIGADFSYQIDVFGRIRNAVAASDYRAKASAADVAALKLSLQTELATVYFSLRAADAAVQKLDKIIAVYRKALNLVMRRHREGTAALVDVEQAKVQLENAATKRIDMHLQRIQHEHAIAVLIGEIPTGFSIKPIRYQPKFIFIASYLPSTLLEQRPDITAAEKRVQAANAEIGVARAAYFPDFNLSAAVALESAMLSNLLKMPSLFWSLGPAATLSLLTPTAALPLFDGGRRLGLLNEATSSYYESVANYRSTVLTAFQEVEDYIAGQRELEKEYRTQMSATTASRRALAQANYRYLGGISSYLEIIIYENSTLEAELALINLQLKRQMTTVQLIKALGGNYH